MLYVETQGSADTSPDLLRLIPGEERETMWINIQIQPQVTPRPPVLQACGLTVPYSRTHTLVLKELSTLWEWKGKDRIHNDSFPPKTLQIRSKTNSEAPPADLGTKML